MVSGSVGEMPFSVSCPSGPCISAASCTRGLSAVSRSTGFSDRTSLPSFSKNTVVLPVRNGVKRLRRISPPRIVPTRNRPLLSSVTGLSPMRKHTAAVPGTKVVSVSVTAAARQEMSVFHASASSCRSSRKLSVISFPPSSISLATGS